MRDPAKKDDVLRVFPWKRALDSRFRGNDKGDAGTPPFCHPRPRAGTSSLRHPRGSEGPGFFVIYFSLRNLAQRDKLRYN